MRELYGWSLSEASLVGKTLLVSILGNEKLELVNAGCLRNRRCCSA